MCENSMSNTAFAEYKFLFLNYLLGGMFVCNQQLICASGNVSSRCQIPEDFPKLCFSIEDLFFSNYSKISFPPVVCVFICISKFKIQCMYLFIEAEQAGIHY